ncbi:hypothetical protein A3SI_12859 [Nitritalea halalkaliphila LW7]|uniref:Uncharacterized protein n=1 Tax=Nitritalea halalkaliphila LW7 TaxID=1189621 RepID=I5C1M9_9BACT|nr:hypothetical protein [Nitritalea halalkaliphila]EIM75731.1 hypothetical protein A3SI_12859 [Nitritalea halalkaliphila LW7]
MKKIGILALFLGMSWGVSAQQIAQITMDGTPARITPYTGVEGSPYLFKDWVDADITLRNGKVREGVPLKVNIYEGELEVLLDGDNRIILNKRTVDAVKVPRPEGSFDASKGELPALVFKKGFTGIKGVKEDDFVNVLFESDAYTLIRVYHNTLQEPAKNTYATSPGQIFVVSTSFFLVDREGKSQGVRLAAKPILKALHPDHEQEAKRIVKAEGLKLSREDHVITLLQMLSE